MYHANSLACARTDSFSQADALRIEGWVNAAVTKGAQVLAGGKRYGQVSKHAAE